MVYLSSSPHGRALSERTVVREEEEERPNASEFRGAYENRGNEACEVRSDDVPCKLNNAEAKRTHQVGAVRKYRKRK